MARMKPTPLPGVPKPKMATPHTKGAGGAIKKGPAGPKMKKIAPTKKGPAGQAKSVGKKTY